MQLAINGTPSLNLKQSLCPILCADFLGRKSFPDASSQIQQLNSFVASMEGALSSVGVLEIDVEVTACKRPRPDLSGNQGGSMHTLLKRAQPTGVAVSYLLANLAKACRNTTYLVLSGHMEAADLQALGVNMPNLTSVVANNVSPTHNLHQALEQHVFPRLTDFKLLGKQGTHDACKTFELLSSYPRLSHLSVGPHMLGEEPSEWESLPCRLKDLHCTLLPPKLSKYLWLGGLQVLCLQRAVQYPMSVLANLLKAAPCLGLISVAGFEKTPSAHLDLARCSWNRMVNLCTLHKRCLTGLRLNGVDIICAGCSLNGTLLTMTELLSYVKLPAITSCVLVAAARDDLNGCMTKAITAFPSLEKLKLTGPWPHKDLLQVVGFQKLKQFEINKVTCDVTKQAINQLME